MSDTDEYTQITERRLCATCIGESFLRTEVDRLGETSLCDYCGHTGSTLSIGEIAGRVDTAFEQHYERTPTEPSAIEYAMMGNDGWFPDGDPVVYVIADAAEVEDKPADDIRRVLEGQQDYEMAQMGEDNPFAEEAHYIDKEPDDIVYWNRWRYFENNLKSEARFFSSAAEATLDEVFEGLSELRQPDGTPIIVDVGPRTEMTSFFRARVFQAEEELEEALKRPDLHMGPPPVAMAKTGRMNANGISVFYGATDSSIAISEVRPPVGSRVIVGEFALLRNISLLDVNALRSVFIKGSVFDPTYMRQLERARFLEYVSKHISRPVMPNDQPLEYLVTQVVADYLASRSTPALDGILYPSVQDGTPGSNVILFHKASRVKLIDIAAETEIDVSTGHHYEEGWETDYSVVELLPQTENQIQEDEDNDTPLGVSGIFSPSPVTTDDYDGRKITLRLKLKSLQVHHVSAARYDTDVHLVRRHQMVRRETPMPQEPDLL